jgi:hypothetical protein
MAEVTISSTWKSAQPVATNTLVAKVADLYGLSGDDEASQQALDCLDEVVKELNMHLWEFNIVTTSGLTVVANTRSITLPTLFYKEKIGYLVSSDGSKDSPLVYVDWATFERLYASEDHPVSPDTPRAYSVKNQHREGLVYLGPTPDAGTAADKTLTLQYYRRIEIPSQAQQLVVPEEVENVILYGAKKRFAIMIEGPDSPSVARLHLLETDVLEKLQAIDRRHPDEATRFRLYPYASQPARGDLFIRIR